MPAQGVTARKLASSCNTGEKITANKAVIYWFESGSECERGAVVFTLTLGGYCFPSFYSDGVYTNTARLPTV